MYLPKLSPLLSSLTPSLTHQTDTVKKTPTSPPSLPPSLNHQAETEKKKKTAPSKMTLDYRKQSKTKVPTTTLEFLELLSGEVVPPAD